MALRGLENKSDFASASIFADAMMRDPRIHGVLSTRAGSLMATPLYFQPATDRRKAARIRDEIAGSDDTGAGLWEQMFPPSVQGDLSLWGNLVGIAVAEIVWTTTADRWIPRLRMVHPQHIGWDDESRRYYVRTADGGKLMLPDVDAEPRSDGRWLVWAPHSLVNGWRRALVRPLAMLYVARQWCARDWSRYNEKHGMPTDMLKAPAGVKDEDIATMAMAVANRGSEAVVTLPQGDTEQGSWGVSILEPVGRSWDSFKAQIEKADVDIAVCVLGQNLSTEVQGGSFAAAQVHDMVRIDKRKEDAGLARCLRDQVLTWYCLYNYGDAELAPRMAYAVDPPEDEQKMATVYETVGHAIAALQDTGAPVDTLAILDEYAVPVLDEQAQAEAAADGMTVNEARARKGLGPLLLADGTPDPDGELTVIEYFAKHGGAGPAAGGTEEGTAALRIALGAQVAALKAKKRPARQTAAAAKRAQRYALRVAARAQERARAALSGDVAELMEAVRGAKDLEDVKRRVAAKYKALRGKDLARVLEKANLLAQMAGRVSGLEDL